VNELVTGLVILVGLVHRSIQQVSTGYSWALRLFVVG
jgi:hypothetical protein